MLYITLLMLPESNGEPACMWNPALLAGRWRPCHYDFTPRVGIRRCRRFASPLQHIAPENEATQDTAERARCMLALMNCLDLRQLVATQSLNRVLERTGRLGVEAFQFFFSNRLAG